MRAPIALLAVAALLGSGCLQPAPKAPVFGPGVATASNQLAAEAGASVLRAGGNAVDAAAAVQWALEATEPEMSGLGGGALILLWLQSEQRYVYIDGREWAPASASRGQFMDATTGQPMEFAKAERMGIAVGVPGTLKAWDLAVSRYGTRPLSGSFGPAIAIARDGFPVDAHLAGFIADAQDKLRSWPPSARLYIPDAVCPPDNGPLLQAAGTLGCTGGTPLAPGNILVQPDLAATLQQVARDGPAAFYDGPVGADVRSAVAARGGQMGAGDFSVYQGKERAAVSVRYGDARVTSAAPPTAGGLTMGEILEIVEPLKLRQYGAGSGEALHRFTEATRLAYQDRYAYIGDSDVVQVPAHGLVDPAFAAERRALIDPAKANGHPTPGDPWPHEPGGRPAGAAAGGASSGREGPHTTHFTVVDKWGNIASVTSTIEDVFGSGILVPGRGIMLNNELTDFDFRPGGPNEVGPHKRPRSSMAPTILERGGQPFAAYGSPGGPTITTTATEVTLDLLEYGMTLPEAVAAPRTFAADYPGVAWEAGTPAAALDLLRQRGDQPDAAPSVIGNVQGAWRDPAGWHGVADHRDGDGGVAYA